MEPCEIPITWKGSFHWPVNINDPSVGWVKDEEEEGNEDDQEGMNEENNPPNLDVNLEIEKDLTSQEANPNLTVNEDIIIPSQEPIVAVTGSKAGASVEGSVAHVGGGVHSPIPQSD